LNFSYLSLSYYLVWLIYIYFFDRLLQIITILLFSKFALFTCPQSRTIIINIQITRVAATPERVKPWLISFIIEL
jgi:hypothetical protein